MKIVPINKIILKDAIIGTDHDSERIIYSINKCMDIFVKVGMTEEEAADRLYYDIIIKDNGESIFCEDT